MFGIVLIVFGFVLRQAYEEQYTACQDSSYDALYPEQCSFAWFMYGLGLMQIWGGVFISLIGLYLVLSIKPDPLKRKYRCHRCNAEITYESNPTDCYWCGVMIDWSNLMDKH